MIIYRTRKKSEMEAADGIVANKIIKFQTGYN